MGIIVNDDDKCQCGAYWQMNGFCCNGHPRPPNKEGVLKSDITMESWGPVNLQQYPEVAARLKKLRDKHTPWKVPLNGELLPLCGDTIAMTLDLCGKPLEVRGKVLSKIEGEQGIEFIIVNYTAYRWSSIIMFDIIHRDYSNLKIDDELGKVSQMFEKMKGEKMSR